MPKATQITYLQEGAEITYLRREAPAILLQASCPNGHTFLSLPPKQIDILCYGNSQCPHCDDPDSLLVFRLVRGMRSYLLRATPVDQSHPPIIHHYYGEKDLL